jgi:branched-subunit amino acid aminotransferase/4-amino-4-deoxychorismate lyase
VSCEWRDGRLVEVGARRERRGAGWGVFTTVGCDWGRPLLWRWHRERLSTSLARLGAGDIIQLPDEREVCRLLAAEGLEGPARLRVDGRAGIDSPWRVVATAAELSESGPDTRPCRLVIERWAGVPPMAGHKMVNRPKWDLALDRARRNGADDALLVDASGHVLETSVANIWVRHGNDLLTPPAPERCLPGVMRRWLLKIGETVGLRARERDLRVDDVAGADEVLLSNAVVGLRRVSRVVDRRWSEWPLFERLVAAGVPAPGWP